MDLNSKARGIALIMILLVLMILVVLVNQLSYTSKVDSYVAKNSSNQLENRYALLSAVNHAIAYLQLDAMQEKGSKKKYDALSDAWGEKRKIEFPGTTVFYSICDESSKFDLLSLLEKKKEENEKPDGDKKPEGDKKEDKKKPLPAPERFDRLIESLQEKGSIVKPQKLRESIVSWMKEKQGRPNLKGTFYQKVPIFSRKELLLVKDMTPLVLEGIEGMSDRYPGLKDHVTVWSDGLININTAPQKVVESLASEMSKDLAKKIVEYRNQEGESGKKQVFKSKEDIKKVSSEITESLYKQIEPLIAVQSHYFSIQATAISGRLKSQITVIVYRSGKRVYKLYTDYEE